MEFPIRDPRTSDTKGGWRAPQHANFEAAYDYTIRTTIMRQFSKPEVDTRWYPVKRAVVGVLIMFSCGCWSYRNSINALCSQGSGQFIVFSCHDENSLEPIDAVRLSMKLFGSKMIELASLYCPDSDRLYDHEQNMMEFCNGILRCLRSPISMQLLINYQHLHRNIGNEAAIQRHSNTGCLQYYGTRSLTKI
jgi:hypothetical protein